RELAHDAWEIAAQVDSGREEIRNYKDVGCAALDQHGGGLIQVRSSQFQKRCFGGQPRRVLHLRREPADRVICGRYAGPMREHHEGGHTVWISEEFLSAAFIIFMWLSRK